MRVLLTSTPTYGHFHPLVPLARALIAAGHEVRVACAASFRNAVAGLPFVAAGSADLAPSLVAELGAARPDATRRARLMLTRVLLGIQARAMAPDVLALIDDWRPDLLLRDHLECGDRGHAGKCARRRIARATRSRTPAAPCHHIVTVRHA